MLISPCHVVSCIGAPTDVGTSTQGTHNGPDALRRAGLVHALESRGVHVHDYGDVHGPDNPHQDHSQPYRNLAEVTQWNQAVHDAVYAELIQGRMPMLLGGDHSLAVGSIAAVARHCREKNQPLYVVWIDAHADYNTVDTSPSGNMHGMPLTLLCGKGPSALTHMSGVCPALQVHQIRQIGVRSIDPLEQVAVEQTHLQVFTMQHIRLRGIDAVLNDVLRDLPDTAHLHVSFDVDCLDPHDAPGVGTPAADGPNLDDIRTCLGRIAQTGLMGSLDVVELNPQRDEHGKTTALVLDLLQHMLSAHALAKCRFDMDAFHRVDEAALTSALIAHVQAQHLPFAEIEQTAEGQAEVLRIQTKHGSGLNRLMLEYSLSSEEGLALMCLTEALLRIPDVQTREVLIRDTLGHANWLSHIGHSSSLFVNATTWGLLIAGKWCDSPSENTLNAAAQSLWRKGGTTLVRRAVELAVGMMGSQFVMAQTIEEALSKTKTRVEQGFTFSFDMLGESALSQQHAQAYFDSYAHAIDHIGHGQRAGVVAGHGISVKLSALHPRYCMQQRERVHAELYPRLYALALKAKQYDMGLNIDAEESERLTLSLELIQRLACEPALKGWAGLGIVVQSYQTRALMVVRYLVQLAKTTGQRFMVRLVKGAYWDSEIKRCQQMGLSHFPVFTRKSHTDVAYLACAAELIAHADCIYPQFATHNVHTFACVQALAKQQGVRDFEMQCLLGMGETLYAEPLELSRRTNQPLRCRIYAPVGAHISLLPYLVRRLLENGANSSFVSQMVDPHVSLKALVKNPLELAANEPLLSAPCKLPSALFSPSRLNSAGVDWLSEVEIKKWNQIKQRHRHKKPQQAVVYASEQQVQQALVDAMDYASTWQSTSKLQRANFLLRTADLLERERDELLYLLCTEAKKTWPNALAEVREAVDFCRYYARQLLDSKKSLEQTGLAVCISPWNFPLAIFMGQVAAALACGYCVIAKPAEQTPHIAQLAIHLLHRAHVPMYAVQCVQGDASIGALLVASPHVRAVLFTGSNAAAKHIQHSLLQHGPGHLPALLVAETGGQNAMLVDSSAHLEQVVHDVLESAFDSAGQRCSALRVLCIQQDIAEPLLALLKAAMCELVLGNPLDIHTDVGPVIDHAAYTAIVEHIDSMRAKGHAVWQTQRTVTHEDPAYLVPPTLINISNLNQLQHEVFGPVLHVLVYPAGQSTAIVEQINATGFALTFGIHSRVQSEIERWADSIRAGNVYINRNMVGAVVGSQPFGGNGLSGTGPKAGGPLYLPYLMGDTAPHGARELELLGPTGERNVYRLLPRGRVWCSARDEAQLRHQIQACVATGNTALVVLGDQHEKPSWADALEHHGQTICWVEALDYNAIDAVLCERNLAYIHHIHTCMAEQAKAIVPIVLEYAQGHYPTHALYREQVVSTNTTAKGGNASLINMPRLI